MEKLMSLVGIIIILGISYIMSSNKKAINWRMIPIGLGFMLVFAILVIPESFFNKWIKSLSIIKDLLEGSAYKSPGEAFFAVINTFITKIIGFSDKAMTFLLDTDLTSRKSLFNNMLFRALPLLVFFSSLMAVFYHLGIMQKIIKFFAIIIGKLFKSSGAETLAVVSNVFVGMVESMLAIRPFLSKLTRSELFVVMVSGMATIAGSVFAVYVSILQKSIPNVAGHLLTASIISAPAAIILAKMMIPEDQKPITLGQFNVKIPSSSVNVLDAAATGAKDGLKLAFNVGAILLAFIGIIYLIDYLFQLPQPLFIGKDKPLQIQELIGHLFRPVTYFLGIPWQDSLVSGKLLGTKVVLNEWIAYEDLAKNIKSFSFARSKIIISYALCGFANLGSIGIMIGGLSTIAPDRVKELATLGLKAMLAGLLAGLMTACVAGIII